MTTEVGSVELEGDTPGHHNMGTVISFDDIVLQDSRKVSVNKPQEEVCFIRIAVTQTGN